jgi:hypothetical protein
MLFISRLLICLLVAVVCLHHVAAELPPSMANDTTCKSLGITDVTVYQYNLPISTEFGSAYAGPVFFPIFSSIPLDAYNAEITQVLVAIHGLNRNADDFFCSALKAAQDQPNKKNILVISPW